MNPAIEENGHSDPVEEIETLESKDAARLLHGARGIRSLSLTGLFLLACFYTLYFAREFFLPITIAVLLTFLLGPLVRVMKTAHIPEFISSAVVISAAFAILGLGIYELSGPVAQWLQRAPEIASKLETGVRHLRKRVAKVSQASDRVRELAKMNPESERRPQPVELEQNAPLIGFFGETWSFLFGLTVMVILLYFLLASGDMFLRKLIHVLPSFRDKKKAVQIARQIEDSISRYLITAAMVNATLGSIAALSFWALGMPNPLLWGAMGALLNFIPFLGAIATIIIVAGVAMATFPLGHALLAPLAYLGLAILEGSFVTPWFVGRRMIVNPVVIFIGLVFWGWLWGIPGALLAVPMIVMFKIFCDHIEPLAPIGEFLGA